MRVLVTGGAGYLGSSLCHLLGELGGYETVVFDRRLDPSCEVSALTPSICNGFDAVVHLAGISKAGDHSGRAMENIGEFKRLLFCAGARYLVLASTCALYGAGRNNELSPIVPNCEYSRSKIAMERLASSSGIVLRFGALCGESPQMRWDMAVNFMTRAAWESNSLEVWGDNVRPYVHVKDAALAIVQALNSKASGIHNVVGWNMSTRRLSHSIACLVSYWTGRYVDVVDRIYRSDGRSFSVTSETNLFHPTMKLDDAVLGCLNVLARQGYQGCRS